MVNSQARKLQLELTKVCDVVQLMARMDASLAPVIDEVGHLHLEYVDGLQVVGVDAEDVARRHSALSHRICGHLSQSFKLECDSRTLA